MRRNENEQVQLYNLPGEATEIIDIISNENSGHMPHNLSDAPADSSQNLNYLPSGHYQHAMVSKKYKLVE